MGFFSLSLFFPVILVGLIVVAIRTILLTIRVPPSVSREPACEACRYRVAGLSNFTCPECGNDLRHTGIITLPMEIRRRGSLFGAIVGWAYLMVLVGAVGTAVITTIAAGQFRSVTNTTSTVTTTPLTPASGAYTRVDTITTFGGPRGPSGDTEFDLILTNGSVWKLTFAPLGAGYTIVGPDGSSATTPDDGKAPDALFAAAGLNAADPNIVSEARELSTISGVLASAPWTPVNTIRLRSLTPGTSSVVAGGVVSGGPDARTLILLVVAGLVVWGGMLTAGIIFIVLGRKRLLRQYVITSPPPQALVQA